MFGCGKSLPDLILGFMFGFSLAMSLCRLAWEEWSAEWKRKKELEDWAKEWKQKNQNHIG